MARYCCLCFRRKMVLQEPKWLSAEDSDEIVCNACWRLLDNLEHAETLEAVDAAKGALKPFFESEDVEESVKDILRRNVEKAYDRLCGKFAEQPLITTGDGFEGFKIVKYCGVLSGEAVLGAWDLSELESNSSDFFVAQSNSFAEKMKEAKEVAKNQLIRTALKKSANALIGLDFDYVTFGNNVIGVSANATAVVVQKEEG